MLGELVDVEQSDTGPWLEMRKGKFTGSAVAALMDQSKYKPRTFREYWLWRKGFLDTSDDNEFTKLAYAWGHAQEPIALNRVCEELQTEFKPACFIHEDLMSSLDGFNIDASAQLEIKCPKTGRKSDTWKYVAENEDVPPWYIWQMVMGHHLTEADHSFFYVYDGVTGTSLPPVEVSNNYLTHLWHDELGPAIERMRIALQSDIAPGEIVDPEMVAKAERLRVVMAEKKVLVDEESLLKTSLKDASNGVSAWCGGVAISWVESTRFDKAKAKRDGVPIETYETTSRSARITV